MNKNNAVHFAELSHLIKDKMPAFPGDKEASLTQSNTVEQDGFSNYKLTVGMHVGTHMDAPAHMVEGGKQLFEYSNSRFVGNADLIDSRGKREIDLELLEQLPEATSKILLICTSHSEKYGDSDYYHTYPELTEEFVKKVVELGYQIIGLDTPSPDYAQYLIHQLLFENDVLIIENLTNLKSVFGFDRIQIMALPLYVKTDSAPVRVVAKCS